MCLRKVEPGRIWELFESEEITHYCAAATVQIGIVDDDAAHRVDTKMTVVAAPPSAGVSEPRPFLSPLFTQ